MKSESSTAPARWMLVDDDAAAREAMASLLAVIARVEVVSFSSGAEALNAFVAAPGSFGFIVTDLEMPEMSGIELCRRIKAVRPQMMILLATGSGVIAQQEAAGLGFCGMISKPFSVATLRLALAAAASLDNHQPNQAATAPVCMAA